MRAALSTSLLTLAIVGSLLIGAVAGAYYETAAEVPSTVTVTSTSVVTTTLPPNLETAGINGLYVSEVSFTPDNITLTVSNSGGGAPISGYGANGSVGRLIGSITVFDGNLYSQYASTCAPNSPCATAGGPWTYFVLEGTSPALRAPWNSGNATYYGTPVTVDAMVTIPIDFNWAPDVPYTIYLQDTNNTIEFMQTFMPPG